MKANRGYPIVTVTEKGERFIKGGHVWVYAQEIVNIDGEIKNGEIADVVTKKGRFLGSGFYNSNSKIAVRIISKNANDTFDEAFFERRLRYSFEYRKTVMGSDFSCCRLIFGEADGLPGLTVDRFKNVLVTQTLSLGIDKIKDMLFPLMLKVLSQMGEKCDIIYERNDVPIREKEGLTQYKDFFYKGENAENADGIVIIEENEIKYNVDYISGQKTGFFLDQKYNRQAAAKIAKDKNVLDCFTHTGAFALCCAKNGAKSVTAVDVSSLAIQNAQNNAKLNELNIDFMCENVFDLLTQIYNSGKKPYDFIILDPPAFTKSSSTVKNAIAGYKEINLKAMKALPRGGYLATCSCSHFMTEELFEKMLLSAAKDAGVSLLQIEKRQQSPDHPILWNVPETNYLKFYIFQVV